VYFQWRKRGGEVCHKGRKDAILGGPSKSPSQRVHKFSLCELKSRGQESEQKGEMKSTLMLKYRDSQLVEKQGRGSEKVTSKRKSEILFTYKPHLEKNGLRKWEG